MAKNKIAQWAEMDTFPHVVQPAMEDIMSDNVGIKGNWHKDFFKNDNDIVLELGCGKGEYSVGLARKYPNKNFLGVDIKGHRMWRGAKTALDEGITNVGFLRTRIDFINALFAQDEVSEIWLTFSDPQPKKERKRLTSPIFIDKYKRLMKSGGIIHLKCDSDLLYEYTLEQVEEYNYSLLYSTWDLYGEGINDLDEDTRDILNIRTFYEQMWLGMGKSIKYCKFKL